MEYALTKIATQLVYPLSVSIGLSLLGWFALARGRTRLASWLIGVAVVLLWFASIPAVGFLSNQGLQSRFPPVAAEDAANASAIVLLGGALSPAAPPRNWMDLNESVDRIVHAARLYRAGKAPFIVATGGGGPQDAPQRPAEATADLLVEWGLPRDAILIERKSRNTYENAIYTKQLLDAHGIAGPVLLVTSAKHMQRSVLLFESAGVEVVPAPTDFSRGELRLGDLRTWLPDAGSLRATSAAFKEWLGIAVDRVRGRTHRAPE